MRLAHRRVQTYFEEIERSYDKHSQSGVVGQPASKGRVGKDLLQSGSPLQTCQASSGVEPKDDLWLLDMCYRVAVVRHIQMREECVRQLGRLLLRAKEAENSRRSAIAKACGESIRILVTSTALLLISHYSRTDILHVIPYAIVSA